LVDESVSILLRNDKNFQNQKLETINNYKTVLLNLNDHSDKKAFNYPFRKIFNENLYNTKTTNLNFIKNLNNTNFNSQILNYTNHSFKNSPKTEKFIINQSSNQSFLPSEQNLRQYKNLTPNQLSFNLSNQENAFKNKSFTNLDTSYTSSKTG